MSIGVLACSSAGGHFKQLVRLVRRIPELGSVTWVTYDSGLTETVLEQAGRAGDELRFAPYAGPRDLHNLARDAAVVRRLLAERSFDLAVSTGAGIAVASLPLARSRGIRACYIESVARATAPSLSGRILERTPGIELYSQYRGFASRWRYLGSVFDEFEAGPEHDRQPDIQRVVVTLGTSERYGFRRLVEQLIAILPLGTEVLWQTGTTNTDGLAIGGLTHVPGPELEAAMREADVVVAHAGAGSSLSAFENGVYPVLVPRRQELGENVDNHQEIMAADLSDRGLAMAVEATDLTLQHLQQAARRTVRHRGELPSLPL